jgi:hypothetical protein
MDGSGSVPTAATSIPTGLVAGLQTMGVPPHGPIADPLLQPEHGPRDAKGAPIRAPLGNSIRTLLVFALLVAVGVIVWWIRRPDDLSERLGGREWAITEVDGEPATNRVGLVSTFVLDGTGEIRAVRDCNVESGRWEFDRRSSHLGIEWTTQTDLDCGADWPQTYTPGAGHVTFDGMTLRIEADRVDVRAIALGDHEPASPTDFAGTWISGESSVEIGQRGLFDVAGCRGSWSAEEEGDGIIVSFRDVQADDCELAPVWADEQTLVPVIHDHSLYLWRNRTVFPLDHKIVRLDPVPG